MAERKMKVHEWEQEKGMLTHGSPDLEQVVTEAEFDKLCEKHGASAIPGNAVPNDKILDQDASNEQ